MRGGALSVDSVDSSAKAVTLTDANIHLNFPDDTRHRSHAEDAFKFLADMPHGAYDLIVLDPPAFAKHRSAYTQCFARLSEDQRQGIRQNRPGRHTVHIFVLTGHHPRTVQARGILGLQPRAGCKVRILHQLTQPADHPVNIYIIPKANTSKD